ADGQGQAAQADALEEAAPGRARVVAALAVDELGQVVLERAHAGVVLVVDLGHQVAELGLGDVRVATRPGSEHPATLGAVTRRSTSRHPHGTAAPNTEQ